MRNPSDILHPWRSVTNARGGNSPVAGWARRTGTRFIYNHLARTYPQAEWTTMNYGYAELPGESANVAIDPGVPEHLSLQLYARAAAAVNRRWADLDVLEIGSGRGGGAAYIAHRFVPRRLVGLDISPVATALAHQLHGTNAVEFMQGDAEDLAFAPETFDVVFNVESAHCYGSVSRFLTQVHRVLRPNGQLVLTDFVSRRNGALDRFLEALAQGPLRQRQAEDITANVLLALKQDEARKRELLNRWVKGWMKSFAQGAYAMEGSAMRRELLTGRTAYLFIVLEKWSNDQSRPGQTDDSIGL